MFLSILAATVSIFSCRHPFTSPADPDGEKYLGKLTVYPFKGVTVPAQTPYLSWDEVDGAAKYLLQFADDEETLPDAPEIEVVGGGYRVEEELNSGQSYYWSVRPVDGDGNKGIKSVSNFTLGEEYSVEAINAALEESGVDARVKEVVPFGETATYTLYAGEYYEKTETFSGYGLSETEVTQKDYRLLVGEIDPLDAGEGDDYPVYNVTLNDSILFCNRLSKYIGLVAVYTWKEEYQEGGETYPAHYTADLKKNGFYIPSHTQWDYAAGGPNHYTYPLGDTFNQDDYIFDVSGTSPAASKSANGFGLYDMGGNVSERVSADSDLFSSSSDYSGDADGSYSRGGSWQSDHPDDMLSEKWWWYTNNADAVDNSMGIRVAIGRWGK